MRRGLEDDSRTMRLAATLVVLAASVMLVGLAWLQVLSHERGAPGPTRSVVSLHKTQADDRTWERVAVTLQPDPLSLPPPTVEQTAAALGEPDLADWMLQGLESGGMKVRRERTEQR